MKKSFVRSFSFSSFALGITIGIVGTAIGATTVGSSVFPDVPFGSYYDEAIGEMYSLGVITGFGDGTFKPDDGLSRGQAAVMMKRLRDEIKGIQPPPPPPPPSTSTRRTRTTTTSSSSSSAASPPPVTVNENGKFRFITNAYKQEEDDGSTNVTVVRTGGKEGMVTVDYALTGATATAGSDFETQLGTLVYQDGETSKTFAVKILNDEDNEGDETITMEIKNPTGGAEIIEPKVSIFTITDDESAAAPGTTTSSDSPEEGTLRFTAMEFGVSEESDDVTIRIERIGGTKGAVTVGYSMSDGTARSGTNYTKTSGTLNFADGDTVKTFTIGIQGNTQIGGSKTVNLTLANPTGGAALDPDRKTSLLRIADDEVASYGSGSFRFSDNEYEVLESEGSIDIIITRSGGSSGVATVQYKTSDGTARVGSDYKESEGVMRFEDGETTKSFSVEVIKDAAADAGESINLNLSTPSGAGLTTPNFATLWIY
jgi:hypothetical protein